MFFYNKTFVRQMLILLAVNWSFFSETVVVAKGLRQKETIYEYAYVNTFMYGCSSSWFANAMTFLTKPDHKPFISLQQYELLAQIFEAGRLLLAIPAGMIMDRFGRKKTITLIGLLNIVAWVLLSLNISTYLIYVCRFMQGVTAALLYVSSLCTIGEIASPCFRGTFASLHEVANMMGQLFESIVTVAFDSYQILSYSTAAAAFLFVPTLLWLIESPNYLVHRSQHKKAKTNLAKIRPTLAPSELDVEFEQMATAIENEKAQKKEVNWLNVFRVKVIRKAFKVGLLLNLVSSACGGVVIASYISVIVPPNEYFSSKFYPLISYIVQFCAAFTSSFFIELFPRRSLYMAAAFVSLALQLLNVFFSWLHIEHPSHISRWALIGNCFLYLFIDRGLISPVNGTVRLEIFPQSVKGIGNALCAVCQSLMSILFYRLFCLTQTYNVAMYVNFVVYAVDSALLAAIIYFLLPETRGKSLAEVQMSVGGGKSRVQT